MNTLLPLKMFIATIMAFFTMIGGLFTGGVQQKDICMIAHRGYSGKYPENTALAFEKAGEHGSGGAETDIRVTADGIYVTNHDSYIVLEDGTQMDILSHTYEELTQKPLKNSKTKDKVYLTTFEDYLRIMKKYDMICFVELKGAFSEEQVKEIFTIAGEVYDINKVMLQSFNFDNLIHAKELFPDLTVMLTYGTSDTGYERCFEYGISIDCNINKLDDKMIEEFHEHGLLVACYTANDIFALSYAKQFDVDFIESDYYSSTKGC